jgi:hypothetical protein
MTEQLNNEAPKRKRRTKAEMEAARAAGEAPAKRVKKDTGETKKGDEQAPKAPKAPETYAAKPKLKPEQSVLIMACLEPQVAKKAMDAAKERGVEVVILEDKVIHDYLDMKTKKPESLGEFLSNTSNRLQAEQNRTKLWMIVTGGAPVEQASTRIITETEVVKKTTLSHGQAKAMFNLLRAFGLLRFTKGTHEFVLNFDKNDCHNTIETEVLSMAEVMNNDILRFKNSIESDTSLSEEQKKQKYDEFKNSVCESLRF